MFHLHCTASRTAALIAIFCAGAGAAADSPKRAAKVTQIIAHRGSSGDRPECTLAAIERAIEVGATAVEVDVRTSNDGALVILHDPTVDRTTDGTGKVSELTLAQLRRLDAGSWFDARYKNERVPTLEEVLRTCRGRIDVLLDLKEQGSGYAEQVAAEIRRRGDPKRIIVGVRSVEQARLFRRLLPAARQLGLIARPEEIESYAAAGVETIRLWPRWLAGGSLIQRVEKAGAKLHLNGSLGTAEEIEPLLVHRPDSLSSDYPQRLIQTLAKLRER